eukprot:jgi/Pico_ML_1/52134/g2893.t2
MTVLGSGGSKDFYFTPQPGLWCSNQSEEVIQKLFAAYEKEPYPTPEQYEEIAKEVGAPGIYQVESFFKNMHVKKQDNFV